MVLNGHLKMGPQNIFIFVFYHSVCHQHVTFLQRFYAHSLSVREVSALRLLFISMTVLQHLKTPGELVKNYLVSAGFVINVEKSDFNPKTKGKSLGTIIDTIEMAFTVPSEKINKLLADIKNILMQNVLTPKQLAKITGQLSSMHLARKRLCGRASLCGLCQRKENVRVDKLACVGRGRS